MDNDKPAFTQAQAQIERLMNLKEKKDKVDQIKKEEEFRFAELPHAITNNVSANAPLTNDGFEETTTANHTAGKAANAAPEIKKERNKKPQRPSKLDRRNFERVRKTVKTIKEAGNSMRLSDDMFINMVLEKILNLNIDFSKALTSEDVRDIINKIKAE